MAAKLKFMIYLYYFDGKLKNAPHKYPDSTGLVRELNEWTHKIDATNGVSATTARFNRLLESNEKTNIDFHVLTNCLHLAERYEYVFVYEDKYSTWVMVEGKAVLRK